MRRTGQEKTVACVILAGGLGKRMKSPTPKVLYRLLGKPMISYALESALALAPGKILIVTGKNDAPIKETLQPACKAAKGKIGFARQSKPLGTAHALQCAVKSLGGFEGSLVVLNGDSPLLTPKNIKTLLRNHRRDGNALSVCSFAAESPGSYGRILRDAEGTPMGIVEKTDLARNTTNVREVNSGLYVFEPPALKLLTKIRLNPKKREYYLTDILGIARRHGLKAGVYCAPAPEDFLGVNSHAELRQAESVLRKRLVEGLSAKGVRFIEPGLVFMEAGVIIAPGATIYPNVHLQGGTRVAKGCTIYPNTRIIDSILMEGAIVKDFSVLENSRIGKNAQIGPFARLRPGSVVKAMARVGNFVEIKNSTVGEGSKAMHLSYIGDSFVGKGVNIGAGTITCNYDGLKKNKTVIEDGVFIGSDSQLIAPVRIKKGSYVAAGSTICTDVPAEALAISRVPQKNIKGWAGKRLRIKGKKKKTSGSNKK